MAVSGRYGGAESGDRILQRLAPAMAAAAQKIYDAWEQDEKGESDEYGAGGICDDIADEIVSVLSGAGYDATTRHDESENHTAVYAKLPAGIFYVDIPCRVYETGTFYKYEKRPDVTIDAEDVIWDRIYDDTSKWDQIEEG